MKTRTTTPPKTHDERRPLRVDPDAERKRLEEAHARAANWQRWGPYLSERQWGTVREDYSEHGNCWESFPHDAARSRAYRWGEDGLLGVTDRECRLCFALALWNGRDPILKERLFGLTGPEGNHGEDVKEQYYYLDSTPTHSYMKALYKYPQAEFPYRRLVEENARRGRGADEFELADAGVFDHDAYFDVVAEYAKAAPNDLLIRVTISNRGDAPAPLHVLPTLWFRNTWSWGREGESYGPRPRLMLGDGGAVIAEHPFLENMRFAAEAASDVEPEFLFTENETNSERLFGVPNAVPHVKDAFHDFVIGGNSDAVNLAHVGTKTAALYALTLAPRSSVTLRLRLATAEGFPAEPFAEEFNEIFETRRAEADAFHAPLEPKGLTDEERAVWRQANAGLLWSKQFYHYGVDHWLAGDPSQPKPPDARREGRNHEWRHLYNRDVISMPDKWEYPWYAAWDLAFHMVPFAEIDPEFAKAQLLLLLREWYMHPNGQIPAYEFAFGDVNPPVHAWACWRVYKIAGKRGDRDRLFLARAFQKLLLNFTWWVNRKDPHGHNIFSGGFLGLDNIGVFDRSAPLPTGGHLEQADGTAWMAFFCATMLSMALELAADDPAYEDIASKFFEHFVGIVDAMNHLGGMGLWDGHDGFYYDQIHVDDTQTPLRVRSLVGLVPLLAVEILEDEKIDRLPGFRKRMNWFLDNRPDLAQHISYYVTRRGGTHGHHLLAVPSRGRLERVLGYLFDEGEFLSPYGIRSVSRHHAEHPYVFHAAGQEFRVDYTPGESTTGLFGGNSNWRGPIWFPLNYLLVEALERYDHFYGDTFTIEYPTGSGRKVTLGSAARDIAGRLSRIFLRDGTGRRPAHGDDRRYADDPHWRDLVLFHEYFHGDTGRGLGASHQTGWTALVARCLATSAAARRR